MKSIMAKALLLLSVAFVSSLSAECDGSSCKIEPAIKARVAAFFPSSNRFRKIYDHTLPCYQLEATAKVYKCFSLWANADWLSKNGNSNHLNYFTSIRMVSYSIGLSAAYPLTDQVSAYLGIGPAGAYTEIHNRHVRSHRNETKNIFGLLAKSGFIYNIDCHLFVDFFVDYLYLPSQFHTNVELGGVKAGVGIGYNF